ncbi:multidrug transporter [Desulfonema ishimotonii]|uniref:Multidrug transporter n=2 Tax=Desulfonema ishimotonii TaxID=45657 RepID=A0A401FRM1_9BACT|nr:multidrug transporter [Desulfonema ishimotonii]
MVLARFIRLCSSVFSASVSQEAAALIVNRISDLVRVDRAVLVRLRGRNAILAVTGGGAAAQDSAFAGAVDTLRRQYEQRPEAVVVPRISPEKKELSSHLWKSQQAMNGTQILWLPLWLSSDRSIPPKYALWLERWHGHRWEKSDIELLQHAALFLGHGLMRPRTATHSGRRFIRIALALALLVFLALPVTGSVTAPVRVVPDHPHHVFAPMDGILKDLLVRPGQWVNKNESLFHYDTRVLDKRLDEAYRNVAVAKAKFVRLQGAAHRDPDARADLPVQELEVGQAEAEAEFMVRQRERAEVRTSEPGVIVLDDPDALIGAPLQTGQAVLSVADPAETKLRIMVPASDVGFLKKGARVSVRLDSSPFQSFSALITRIGFDVRVSQNGVPSVLTEAIWLGDPPDVQPGQKGTSKIFGGSTFMGIQILRKPLIRLRSLIGI